METLKPGEQKKAKALPSPMSMNASNQGWKKRNQREKWIGNYKVYRTLGTGASCKVKLGFDKVNRKKVAVKIIKATLDDEYQEIVMEGAKNAQLIKSHKNVLTPIEVGQGKYEKAGKPARVVNFIILELAQGGELLDFINAADRFAESQARYFFKQLIGGLKHVHEQGVSHRDLKPENLIVDKSLNLKIVDWGLSANMKPKKEKKGLGYMDDFCGTSGYQAPEIVLEKPYSGQQIDLFACGVILFIMRAQHIPFDAAKSTDQYYKCIGGGKIDAFWSVHSKNKPDGQNFFSPEFKNLFIAMTQLDPKKRLKIDEVLKHPWMQGPVPSDESIQKEFLTKKQVMNQKIEEESAKQDEEKKQRLAQKKRGGKYRSAGRSETQDLIDENTINQTDLSDTRFKELLPYERVYAQTTEYFSTFDPNVIEEALITHLKNRDVEPKVHETKYKIKFTLAKHQSGGNVDLTNICFRILQVEDHKVCVEFTKQGKCSTLQLYEHFDYIMKNALAFSNDDIYIDPVATEAALPFGIIMDEGEETDDTIDECNEMQFDSYISFNDLRLNQIQTSIFNTQENKVIYQIIWDNTEHGVVANYLNFAGSLVNFQKEKQMVAIGQQTVQDVCELLRMKLVGATRVGKQFVINVDKMIPDFVNEYASGPEDFPSDIIFNSEEWSKQENYMQIVREDESYDQFMELNQPSTYTMVDGFKIIILARYQNDKMCRKLLKNIPHSDKMLKLQINDNETKELISAPQKKMNSD